MDSRNRKTKRFLRQGFLELLEEENLSKIRISDIADQCEYARQSFYTHYSSKEAILQEIVEDLVGGLIDIMKKASGVSLEQVADWLTEPYHPYFLHYFAYMRRHRDEILILLRPGNGTEFPRRFEQVVERYQTVSLQRWHRDLDAVIARENHLFEAWYRTAMRGLMSGLLQWVAYGMVPDEVAMAKHHTHLWLSSLLLIKDEFPQSKYSVLLEETMRKKGRTLFG